MSDEDFLPEIVELPLEDSLDLHSFPPQEIKALVTDYLHEAYAAGFSEVRVIHGKGIGVQRDIVQAVAARDPHVIAIHQAAEEAGGWGATRICFLQEGK